MLSIQQMYFRLPSVVLGSVVKHGLKLPKRLAQVAFGLRGSGVWPQEGSELLAFMQMVA